MRLRLGFTGLSVMQNHGTGSIFRLDHTCFHSPPLFGSAGVDNSCRFWLNGWSPIFHDGFWHALAQNPAISSDAADHRRIGPYMCLMSLIFFSFNEAEFVISPSPLLWRGRHGPRTPGNNPDHREYRVGCCDRVTTWRISQVPSPTPARGPGQRHRFDRWSFCDLTYLNADNTIITATQTLFRRILESPNNSS